MTEVKKSQYIFRIARFKNGEYSHFDVFKLLFGKIEKMPNSNNPTVNVFSDRWTSKREQMCTGAEDVYGAFVFVGDFIKTSEGDIFHVVLDKFGFRLQGYGCCTVESIVKLISQSRIVGNIYQTPELKEVAKNGN